MNTVIDTKTQQLFEAVSSQDVKNHVLVNELLEQGAKVNAKDPLGNTPLLTASLNKDVQTIEVLLKHKADTEIADRYGDTPLMNAMRDAVNLDAARLLIENDANVNARGADGRTLLMNAAQLGRTDQMELLISNGAKVNIATENGTTALMLSVLNEKTKATNMLLKNGADIEAKNKDGLDALSLSDSPYTQQHLRDWLDKRTEDTPEPGRANAGIGIAGKSTKKLEERISELEADNKYKDEALGKFADLLEKSTMSNELLSNICDGQSKLLDDYKKEIQFTLNKDNLDKMRQGKGDIERE
jgi:ankyrin repeat protein